MPAHTPTTTIPVPIYPIYPIIHLTANTPDLHYAIKRTPGASLRVPTCDPLIQLADIDTEVTSELTRILGNLALGDNEIRSKYVTIRTSLPLL